MKIKKTICFSGILSLVLLMSCIPKQNGQTSVSDQRKDLTENERIQSYLNSLDIRMELVDSLFFGRVDMIECVIINNSDYDLRSGSMYDIKQFESGQWKQSQIPLNMIWTDEEIIVPVKSNRRFEASIHYLNLKPGRYRIEKEYEIHLPFKRTTNPHRITLSHEFVINSQNS
jgi:hypothetical protein